MEITANTVLQLNYPLYFDDEGYMCDSLSEARSASYDRDAATTVRRQKCYAREFSELTEDQKELAESFIATNYAKGTKPEELLYIIGKTTGNILLIDYWKSVQNELDVNGMFSVAK